MILLLLDGLDEISNEKNRICFVNQLRTFIATYPTVHLIITSREAGFRTVAGTISSYCEQYSIANLNENGIRHLSFKWHKAILGESNQVEIESNKVCEIILNDPRIIALAENPLLLTTLLFVKRWVGYLPTKKCKLYEEMIKLLLVTWNSAGHEKLDMDESEPQLAFLAYHMTMNGQQKITRDKLEKCIIHSRKELPELLSYTSISPSKFIDQVEERSSLLIQFGLEESEKGTQVTSYEFSHLSFQEYLTAKAIAESWIPNSYNCNLLDEIKPHICEEHWKEVIPLAAVISGRQAKPLIEYLVQLASGNHTDDTTDENDIITMAAFHLANCVASEVPMSQELLEKAITCVIKRKRYLDRINYRNYSVALVSVFNTIMKSKYKNNYYDVIKRTLINGVDAKYLYEFSESWIEICMFENEKATYIINVLKQLKSNNYLKKITGALLMMQIAYEKKHKHFKLDGSEKINTIATDIFSEVLQLLQTDDVLSIYSASWCIAWSGYNESDIIPYKLVNDIYDKLIELWSNDNAPSVLKRIFSWALCSICMPNMQINKRPIIKELIEKRFYNPQNDFDRCAAIHLAILNGYWTIEEVKARINNEQFENELSRKPSRYLVEMGIKM